MKLSGSSDPYVKFNYKGKNIFKSSTIFKNLNPTWNEQFSHLIDDLSTPLQIDVIFLSYHTIFVNASDKIVNLSEGSPKKI